MSQFLNTLIYSVLAGGATVLGLLLILKKEKWARKNSLYLISFAAGTLLATAFFHLMPEALELFSPALFYVLLGFLVLYILEQVIVIHTCQEPGCESHSFGIMAALGIGFHSLLDGIVIGVGFETSYLMGILTALAVLFHELPEGIFTLSILFHAGIVKKKAVLYTVLVALATPLGALLAFFIFRNVSEQILGLLLALSAGSFLYIAASDLIPQTHKISDRKNIPLLLGGVVFVLLISSFL